MANTIGPDARVRSTAFLLSLTFPTLAVAQIEPWLPVPPGPAPETRKFHYSEYEETSVAEALAHLGFVREARPEGEVVESIHAVRLEVIERRDPAPRFLNVVHTLTRAHVIEREVLLRPGDTYRQSLADETQRKLTALPQLSLVLLVAAQGSTPGLVRLVVITKDVWSLRLNWNIAFSGRGLEAFTVEPSETNFLGLQEKVGLIYRWLPLSHSLGADYAAPRLLGSRVAANANAGLIFNNVSGAREGSFGDFQLTYPLWSSLTRWSWGVGGTWIDEVTRRYSNGRLVSFALDPAACDEPSRRCLPYAYRSDVASAGAFVTRSYGWAVKQDVRLGFDGERNHFRLPDTSSYDADVVHAFIADRLPVSDDRVGPYVQYRTYSTEFLRVLDLETLALQEDTRVGHVAYARIYPALRALGSSRDLLGLSAGASYTAALGDGLARVGLESITELEMATGRDADGSVQATLRLASPRLAWGRLVLDGVLLDRYANHLNRLSSLGGDSRLRGYPSGYLVGSDVLAVNVEHRTPPLQLFHSVQLGGAVFYDAGDASQGWRDFYLRQAAGCGLRVLFPQLDRVVFRIDMGFPLVRPLPSGVLPVGFFVTFGQAFSLYEIKPATALSR